MTHEVVYGFQPVLEALKADRVDRLLVARSSGGRTRQLEEAARRAGVRVARAERPELDRAAGTAAHQGVVAVVRGSDDGEPADVDGILDRADAAGEAPLVLLLDGIQDPQNLGAIIRSAHALGAHGIVVPKNRAAGVTPAVVRASAGAALHVPVARVTNLKHALDRLEARHVWTAAAVLDGEPVFRARLDGPLALVIGGEGDGVKPTIAARCDHRVSIPIGRDFDSLNASVAAGVLLYEAVRQRLDKPRREL